MFFIHLLVAIVVGSLVVLAVWHLTERTLGPGVRIRLALPPTLRSRIKRWLARP
ncbi:conserved exported hypothetical protein [Magnetospirillum sp. UT-4]|nr:conserved exported hypothetical protein [Magnetospirillum sp. UT-4]